MLSGACSIVLNLMKLSTILSSASDQASLRLRDAGWHESIVQPRHNFCSCLSGTWVRLCSQYISEAKPVRQRLQTRTPCQNVAVQSRLIRRLGHRKPSQERTTGSSWCDCREGLMESLGVAILDNFAASWGNGVCDQILDIPAPHRARAANQSLRRFCQRGSEWQKWMEPPSKI